MVGVMSKMRNIVFPKNTTTCPFCKADLSKHSTYAANVVKIDGDGLMSYFYDTAYVSDPFITKIILDPIGDDEVLKACKHGYDVLARNTITKDWRNIISVRYNKQDAKYEWYEDSVLKSSDTPPTQWDFSTNRMRARQLKFVADSDMYTTDFSGNEGVSDIDKNTYKIKMNPYISDVFGTGTISGAALTVADTQDNLGNGNSITAQVQSSADDLLYLDRSVPVTHTFWKLTWNEWRGGCKRMEVYGFHYMSTDLTVMPPPKIENFFIAGQIYKLKNQPTQIMNVYVGENEGAGIELNPLSYPQTSLDALRWTTAKCKINSVDYKRIIKGCYYYEPETNNIYIPDKDQDGDSMDSFEAELSGNGARSYLPTTLIARYWFGMGEGVDLTVTADNQGPSYQVEKNAICEIVTQMPDNGESVPLPDAHGKIEKRTIPWLCYNHEIMTLPYNVQTLYGGKFKKPVLRGTELGTDYENDMKFLELFGTRSKGVFSLDKIAGKCVGNVTLYGRPDTVLPESSMENIIQFRAPATWHGQYKAPQNGDVTTVDFYERTGGMPSGAVIIGVKLQNKNTRQTLAWHTPTVLIYAKERDPSTPL